MRFISLPLAPTAITIMAIVTTGSLADDEVPLADDEPPIPVEETGAAQASLETLRAAGRNRLEQLNDEQRYDEAAAVALQILRLTQEEYGEEARQVIDPLVVLAEVQRNGAELAAAEQNLSAAVMLIEKYAGLLSAELIGPLTTLGEIYNQSGLYDKATQTFNRALRLNHVNQGFTNFDQLPIMDGLTDSYTSLNDFEEATFYQESQLEIQQRRLGVANPETAPAYHKLARWYSRHSLYEEAILTYQRADRVVRTALGNDSLERTEGLAGLALVYQQIGNRSASNSTLRKALQLIEESPDNDPLRRASILVALGDNLTRDGKFSSAQGQYVAAWQALPDDAIGTARREFYFGRTVRLAGNLFPNYARRARGRSADQLRTGSVLIDFSIDAKGRVKNPSVVESDPQGLMDRSFLSIYRQSLFRPRYVDGIAEFSDGLLAKHEFWYIDDKKATDGDDLGDSNTDDIGKPSRGKLSYPGGD
jgi:tetratricopeptide (TPR) repeat protein